METKMEWKWNFHSHFAIGCLMLFKDGELGVDDEDASAAVVVLSEVLGYAEDGAGGHAALVVQNMSFVMLLWGLPHSASAFSAASIPSLIPSRSSIGTIMALHEDPVEILKCSSRALPSMQQGTVPAHQPSAGCPGLIDWHNWSGQFQSCVIGMNNTGGGLERLDEEEQDPLEDILMKFKWVK